MPKTTTRMGRRGTVVIPQQVREAVGLEDGATVVVEDRDGAVIIRPAMVLALEVYTPERRAEFLLNAAADAEEYAAARRDVEAMGLDPDSVPHRRPKPRRRR